VSHGLGRRREEGRERDSHELLSSVDGQDPTRDFPLARRDPSRYAGVRSEVSDVIESLGRVINVEVAIPVRDDRLRLNKKGNEKNASSHQSTILEIFFFFRRSID